MKALNPYLTFKGNCEMAFNFYKSVFGNEFITVSRFGEMPLTNGLKTLDADKNKIMHIALPLSKDNILMGSDTGGEWAPTTIIGNNVSLSITAESKEEADRLFDQLSAGGKATMPMNDTFWGEYFGMLTDKFDINWMISFRAETK
jgi:PhnB protein